MTKRSLVVDDTAEDVARGVAERFLTLLHAELASHEELVHIALTGGSMGAKVLQAIARAARTDPLDWVRVHFWWGDERFVPRNDPQRNALQARAALIDGIPGLPAANVHEMPAAGEGLSLDEAPAVYAKELGRFSARGNPWPAFALCFLGVGDDGHIASLFPRSAELEVTDAAVVSVPNAPKPPLERLSLTLPVLTSAERVWLVVAGADKASAVHAALLGDDSPAARVRGVRETIIFADQAAASSIPRSPLSAN